MRVLVVEDEHRIAQSIKKGLEQDGYAVDVEFDGEAGYAAAGTGVYDVILMDVMMPKLDGVEVTKRLRADGVHTPILMLTAKGQPHDEVNGLDAGADDYLAKPFSFGVLTARIRALLRRPHETESTVLTAGEVSLDTATRQITRLGKSIELSKKESAILECLLRNKNQIMSKQAIMAHVWDFDADVLPNNLEVFITYIRRKLEKPFTGKPPVITTVRGLGYMIKDDE